MMPTSHPDYTSGHCAPITAVAADAKGRLYSGGYDGQVIAWEVDGRTPRWVQHHDELVNAVIVVANWLVSVSADRTASAWDLDHGSLCWQVRGGFADDLNVGAFSRDGRYLALAGEEGLISLFDMHDHRSHLCDIWVNECVNGLGFVDWLGIPAMVIATDEGHLAVYDLGGDLLVQEKMPGAIEALHVFQNDKRLAVALDTGAVNLVDMVPGLTTHALACHHATAKAIAVSPDETWLASAAYDGQLLMTALQPGLANRVMAYKDDAQAGWARALTFIPGQPGQLASASLASAPQIWNTDSEALALPDPPVTLGLNAVAADATGAAYLAGDSGWVWAMTEHSIRSVGKADGLVNALVVTATGSLAITGGMTGSLEYFDTTSGTRTRSLAISNSPIVSLAIDEAIDLIAAGSYDGSVHMVAAASGEHINCLSAGAAVKSVAFGPEGVLFAGLADGRLVSWDSKGRYRFDRDGLDLVNAVAWSDAAGLLASVGRDLFVRVWSADGTLHDEVRGVHSRSIKTLAWCPNGQWLATAGYDGQLALWHVTNGQLRHLRSVQAHGKPGVPALTWLDNHHIVSAGWDGAANIWTIDGDCVTSKAISQTAEVYA